jgi:hypothetical protein
LWDASIHPIDLTGNLDRRIGLGVRGSVKDLVNVFDTEKAIDGDLGDILKYQVSEIGDCGVAELSYLNLQVCMQQELKFKALFTLVANIDDRLQAVLG